MEEVEPRHAEQPATHSQKSQKVVIFGVLLLAGAVAFSSLMQYFGSDDNTDAAPAPPPNAATIPALGNNTMAERIEAQRRADAAVSRCNLITHYEVFL